MTGVCCARLQFVANFAWSTRLFVNLRQKYERLSYIKTYSDKKCCLFQLIATLK